MKEPVCTACKGAGIFHDLTDIETPTVETLWGKEHVVTPRLVTQTFGDGRAAIWISPINTRPNYYVVRVDSTLSEDMDSDKFRDMIDEVVEEIIDQFGWHEDHDDDECTEDCEFPRLHDGGVSWGTYNAPTSSCVPCKGTGCVGDSIAGGAR